MFGGGNSDRTVTTEEEICVITTSSDLRFGELIPNIVFVHEYEGFARYNIHACGPSMMCWVDTRTHD